MPQSCQHVRELAQQYNKYVGLPPIVEGHYVPVDESLARGIAQAYEKLPVRSRDSAMDTAYIRLAVEIELQWRFAITHGITFEAWDKEGQPYANSNEMQADVCSNKHLYFFVGGDKHPLLGNVGLGDLSSNDKFRAVHDLFGHSAEGYQFGARGEENAWIHHSMMFSPLAQLALTTETRGQNSWVNFGPNSHLPVRERPFAQQKAALLPADYCDWQDALARKQQ